MKQSPNLASCILPSPTMSSNFVKIATFCVLFGMFVQTAICMQGLTINPMMDIHNLHMSRATLIQKTYIQFIVFIDWTCMTCHVFINIWNALVAHLEEIHQYVHIGVADCTEDKIQCHEFSIKQVPSVRYFPPHCSNNFTGVDLPAGKNLHSVFQVVYHQIETVVMQHILYVPQNLLIYIRDKPIVEPPLNGSTYPPQHVFNPCDQSHLKRFPRHTPVVNINKGNIARIIPHPKPLIVGFFDVHCRPCGRFVEIWDQLARRMHQANIQVTVAAIDCGVDMQICDNYQIDYYPAMMIIAQGTVSPGIPITSRLVLHDVENAVRRYISSLLNVKC